VDTTAATTTHTDSLTSNGTTGFPIWYSNIVSNQEEGTSLPTKIDGMVSLYVTSLDTGTAGAADIPDTSKDTVFFHLFTAWPSAWSTNTNGERTGETQLCSVRIITAGVGLAKIVNTKFSVPSDSAIGSVIYWRIRSALNDSDYSVGRLAGHIHYRGSVTLFAR
jgi:hypothetical protein